MSTLTIELPDSLKKNIEALAAKEGYTVSQFLASPLLSDRSTRPARLLFRGA